MFFLEDLHEMLHDTLVKVFSTQVCITVGSNHFKDAIVNRQERNIKGATSQVIDQNVFFSLFVKAVSNRCSCGFVDDTEHIHP
mmetsp:Transcript_23097/g.44273  ORF Transcript_23097/g.44273 Transcript_23097/m.44273 type:complete len:83 (-) Transcript_23097:629-877(-)